MGILQIAKSLCERSVPIFLWPKKKKEEPLDFENMTPEELLKYEIADEIGLGDKILKGRMEKPDI